jgi:hypothetical protein
VSISPTGLRRDALGIMHTGRFAAGCRRTYGESPSETLRGHWVHEYCIGVAGLQLAQRGNHFPLEQLDTGAVVGRLREIAVRLLTPDVADH